MINYTEGDRVRLRQNVELFNAFWAEKGSLGTVSFVDKDRYVGVTLDVPVDGLEPWENELVFNCDGSDTLECVGYKIEDTVELIEGGAA